MADPFEVRMRFTNQLRQLSASVTSSQKAAQYALRHKDLAEDLHSCILEQLERSNLNMRANIMYFIEHFLDMAHKDGQEDYIRMMQRDIIRVVDAVAPDDGSGAANVKVVRKVLQALHAKSFLDSTILDDIFEVLRERGESYLESSQGDLILSPSSAPLSDMPPSQTAIHTAPPPPPPSSSASTSQHHHHSSSGGVGHANLSKRGGGINTAAPRLDKKQVEQRIEEDRERHKRLRENIWAVPSGEEMDRLLDETSELGEDDMRQVWEEQEEWERSLQAGIPGSGNNECGHETANGTTTGKSSKNGGGKDGKNGTTNGAKDEEKETNGSMDKNGAAKESSKEPMSITAEIAEIKRKQQQEQEEKERQAKEQQEKENQEKDKDGDVAMSSG